MQWIIFLLLAWATNNEMSNFIHDLQHTRHLLVRWRVNKSEDVDCLSITGGDEVSIIRAEWQAVDVDEPVWREEDKIYCRAGNIILNLAAGSQIDIARKYWLI